MSAPLNKTSYKYWLHPEIYPRANTNSKFVDIQYGHRWTPGDRKLQVLEYVSKRQLGYVIKRSPVPTSYGYTPAWLATAPYLGTTWESDMQPYRAFLADRVYSKFKEAALGDSTQLGTLLAERKEAFGMVANRTLGLYRAYRNLRKGDFKGFLKELSVDPKRKHRSRTRSAASEASGLWLEYWFGWSPTVNDLYGLSEVLAGPPPSQRYSAVSTMRLPPKSVYRNDGWMGYRRETEAGYYTLKTGATVQLVNPDLQLLQQMGLINPLSIAWEVVPFSFVVDWFTKFGSVIESTTDFIGCSLTDAYQTDFVRTHESFETGQIGSPFTADTYGFYRFAMKRRKGLARPTATLPRLLNYGNSKTRAATAVSLLNQIFLSGKR